MQKTKIYLYLNYININRPLPILFKNICILSYLTNFSSDRQSRTSSLHKLFCSFDRTLFFKSLVHLTSTEILECCGDIRLFLYQLLDNSKVNDYTIGDDMSLGESL